MPLPKPGNKALFSNSLLIFITRFFPALANLAVVIWYSRQLSQALYGNYQHFWIQLNVLCPLACLGIHVLIITYPPAFVISLLRNIKRKHYTLYVLWLFVIAGIFAFLQFQVLNISLLIPFLFIICYTLAAILESLLIVFSNYNVLVTINVIYSLAFFGIHWFVLNSRFSLQTIFSYLLTLTILRLCVYAGLAISNWQHYNNKNQEDEYEISKVRSLWLHLGLYDITQVLSNFVDKFAISLVLSAQLSAIYFNGSQNIPFLPLLLGAAGSAALIQLARGKNENGSTDIIELMNQMGRALSCIVFPIFLFLLFFREPLLITIFGIRYAPAIPVFAAAILILPVRAYHFTTVLQRMHKGHIINIGAVSEFILGCLLMYPLYLLLGLPGVALSFVISTWLQALFYLLHSARLLHTSPLTLIPYANWIAKLIVFSILFIGIRYVSNVYFTGRIPLLLGSVAMVIMIGGSLYTEYKKQGKHGWS